MKRTVLIFVLVLWAGVTWAEDYVGVAISACAPLKGRAGYFDCIGDLGRQICDGQPSARERKTCLQAYQAYFAAEAKRLEMERALLKADTEARIRRLQQKLTP